MENNLLKFKEHLDIKEGKDKILSDIFNTSFYLCADVYKKGEIYIRNPFKNESVTLIKLDNEDIEYFKNKYLPKLQEEMQEKINKIKKEYGANNL